MRQTFHRRRLTDPTLTRRIASSGGSCPHYGRASSPSYRRSGLMRLLLVTIIPLRSIA